MAANSKRAVLITVRDVPALVKAQGGSTGAFANSLLPDTIDAKVYSTMATEITSAMKDKGVDADVQVVSPAGYTPAKAPDLVRGMLIGGAVGAGVALLLRSLFKR